MAPIMLAAQVLEVHLQKGTHADNAIRHSLDFSEPLLVKARVVQDLGSDPSTVNWRVGVQWAH